MIQWLGMIKLIRIGVLAGVLASFSPGSATSDSAFEKMKGLQGKWAIQSQGKTLSIQMSYEVGSKGSIVTEQFGKELSVFYRDGDSLAMIHFCNAGNQPRLRLTEGGQPGILEFEMFDITNLKEPGASHVQRIIYKFVDDQRVDLEIVWQENKTQASEKYTLNKL